MWRGEREGQNAAVRLFCSLKAEGGHGNIYWESAPPPLFGPTLLGWCLSFSAGGCVLHQYIFSPSPSFASIPPFCEPSADTLHRDTHFLIKKPTAINVRWGQEELEEGERGGRGRCFPLDRLLRMHDESSQTHGLTWWERGGDEKLQTFSQRETDWLTAVHN